jgi:D-beta-D-heptose 7-phosphate kinase/D-beta-D-heptose 1-phosphate adenosyltransferase
MSKLEWIKERIMSREKLYHFVQSQKVKCRKIVFTNGCFDILHHGHLDLLAQAANEGHILIVGVNNDASVKRLKGTERPINDEADRSFQLASLLCVDAVCLFEEDTPLALIQLIQPHVLVKGGDYTKENIIGASEVEAHGGRVAIIPFVEGYSTSNLIRTIRSL